jgi:hypothetical protein
LREGAEIKVRGVARSRLHEILYNRVQNRKIPERFAALGWFEFCDPELGIGMPRLEAGAVGFEIA